VKEAEAKTKWCPMVRASMYADTAVNTNLLPKTQHTDGGWDCCVASNCMMWRKEKDDYGESYGDEIPDDLGYCGLAGRV
jgi:hypothetical protein